MEDDATEGDEPPAKRFKVGAGAFFWGSGLEFFFFWGGGPRAFEVLVWGWNVSSLGAVS